MVVCFYRQSLRDFFAFLLGLFWWCWLIVFVLVDCFLFWCFKLFCCWFIWVLVFCFWVDV